MNSSYISPKEELPWLGVLYNNKFTFKNYIIYRTNLAKRGLYNLSLLSNTIKGLNNNTIRRLFISIITSISDYGSIIWFRSNKNNNLLDYYRKIQNKALRIILGAFKTSPIRALDIEANLLPPYLRLEKLNISYYNRLNSLQENHPIIEFINNNSRYNTQLSRIYSIKNTLRATTLDNNNLLLLSKKDINNYLFKKWKEDWFNSTKNKGKDYTYNIENKPIFRLKPYSIKDYPKPIKSAFFQLKLGHGYFKSYLYNIKREGNNKCPRCPTKEQSPRHLLISCPIYNKERRTLKDLLKSNKLSLPLLLNTKPGILATLDFLEKTKVSTREWFNTLED